MQIGRIFDVQTDGYFSQVIAHIYTFDPYEVGMDTKHEWCVTFIYRSRTETWIKVERHFASEEQAAQYLEDFEQTQASHFAATYKLPE